MSRFIIQADTDDPQELERIRARFESLGIKNVIIIDNGFKVWEVE